MRVGKKANVVEAKKTRSCVVRLEKVSPPPPKSTRSVGPSPRGNLQLHTDEKKFKGPFKKRPISHGGTASPATAIPSSTHMSVKAKETKDKFKMPVKSFKRESVVSVEPESPPPTIAAGRSRRAIKPNPKYASEDMVTPKIIRNVASLGVSSQKKSLGTQDKQQRKRSTSSSDDFYNRDSSDELDEVVDKLYTTIEKQSDSDFSDEPKVVQVPVRKRGRPRKNPPATPSGTPATTAKQPTSQKVQASQLQLLRRSFAASVNRSIEPFTGTKRKHNDSVTGCSSSDNDVDATNSARKRFLPTKPTPVRDFKNSNSGDIAMTVRKTAQTLNGSKLSRAIAELTQIEEPTRNTNIVEKRKLVDGIVATSKLHQQMRSFAATRAPLTMSAKSSNARVMATAKRRSASPATQKIIKSIREENGENKLADSLSSTVDDFETMPTFTIVNINDIINKKGDVLISKASKSQKTDSSGKTDRDSPETAKIIEYKPGPGRRKGMLMNKTIDTLSSKSPLATIKKPPQKILNHTLARKVSSIPGPASSKGNFNISPDKPAPRILNAMVAKKTQPVKPMIANFEDSADDESYPLSLDGDVEEDEASETADDDEDQNESFPVSKRKLTCSTPYPAKKPAPATKENSRSTLNRQPIKTTLQRKLSPEKVVISRQGDKIIKKITCFETWYVIIPEEPTPPVTRNQLDIPLIKLANAATDIQLPTEHWKSKVTLHELSPTMVAKSNLITYMGDLREYNIAEQDRGRYQPSCVMFRRSVNDRTKSRLPYDRAVIFKNKTFFTNIEGKNVKLMGAPSTINSQKEVEILLQIVDSLTLQSALVEPTTTMQ